MTQGRAHENTETPQGVLLLEETPETARHHRALHAFSQNQRRWAELAHRLPSTFPIDELPLDDVVLQGSSVLDYGCGYGRLVRRIHANSPRRLVCADIAPRAGAALLAEHSGVRFQLIENAGRPHFGPDEFDVIVMVGVLSSVFPRTARQLLVANLWHALKPGGSLVIADFGRSEHEDYLARYGRVRFEECTIITAERLYIHHFSPRELCSLFPESRSLRAPLTVEATTVHGNQIPGHIVVGTKRGPE